MIDQFISSGETKWQKMNGIVMLLPHGYEGQGPEHSNARPERFLQLSAEYNMVVANITEPSNFFHLLRRQLTWEFRKPCVVMSPKSLLRHPKVVSPIAEFTSGRFREVLPDTATDPKKVKRVILCTGKVYFDLEEAREKEKIANVALVRLEQLHPLPKTQLLEASLTIPGASDARDCEEAKCFSSDRLQQSTRGRTKNTGGAGAKPLTPAPQSKRDNT
jgi:2-oxoglutarate dehydrogenase E1 component